MDLWFYVTPTLDIDSTLALYSNSYKVSFLLVLLRNKCTKTYQFKTMRKDDVMTSSVHQTSNNLFDNSRWGYA